MVRRITKLAPNSGKAAISLVREHNFYGHNRLSKITFPTFLLYQSKGRQIIWYMKDINIFMLFISSASADSVMGKVFPFCTVSFCEVFLINVEGKF